MYSIYTSGLVRILLSESYYGVVRFIGPSIQITTRKVSEFGFTKKRVIVELSYAKD